MTIVTKNSLTLSNVNDGTITHYAYAYSADGTDRFTTVYPNLNLLDGTKDFSGTWINSDSWATDGTYKGLTVKKRTGKWLGIYKSFTAPKDGKYKFSTYIKSSGDANVIGVVFINGVTAFTNSLGNNFDWNRHSVTIDLKAGDIAFSRYEISTSNTNCILWVAGYKLEEGSIATPYMPSSTEATTADYPSYIGQYTDFTQADSTNPSDYTWSLIRGNDGKDGQDGKDGTNGKDGDPGKVVSDTEPTTRFKGLTWKYSGTSDLTASDGTVILSGTEYYWSGTNWILSEINAHNINGNNLTITDGEFSSTIIDGPVQIQTEIKDDHLLIYKMDTSHNEIHTIALKSDSGLAMTYQNSDTGEYTSAGVNFQGLFMQNNITNEFARLTPRGTDLSTDVPWTNLTLASGFSIGSGGKARYRVKNGVLYIHFRKIVCPAITGNQPNTLCYVPANGRASDGYDSFGVMSATNSTRIQYNDSGDGKVAIVPASNTTSGQGFNGFLICPMD